MPRGGYRKPDKGAVLSPPGALSKRKAVENTAMQNNVAPGGSYGSRKAAEEQLQGAPIAKAEPIEATKIQPVRPTVTTPGVVPLMDETLYPDEAPETGMGFNKGVVSAGPEALNLMPTNVMAKETLKVGEYLPALEAKLLQPGVPDSFKAYVQAVRGAVGVNRTNQQRNIQA